MKLAKVYLIIELLAKQIEIWSNSNKFACNCLVMELHPAVAAATMVDSLCPFASYRFKRYEKSIKKVLGRSKNS